MLVAVGLTAPPGALAPAEPGSASTRAVVDRTVLGDREPGSSPAVDREPTDDPVSSAGVSRTGSGRLEVVPDGAPSNGSRPVRRYAVEVEEGLGVDPASFARAVHTTLSSPRSWGADGAMSFERTDATDGATDGSLAFRVTLASPDTTDRLCAPLRTNGQLSCFNGTRAVINVVRWLEGSQYNPDLSSYRDYLINHEVGHALGHGHEPCPRAGELAPVMQQQSKGIAPCVPNAWPFPDEGSDTSSAG